MNVASRRALIGILGAGLVSGLAAAEEVSAQAPTTAQALAAYPQRLADRPLAIGKGLAEGEIDGSYLFGLGGSEVPEVRYGLTDQLELDLLGVRFIVSEDGRYFPGMAIRLQLHDLAYGPIAGDVYPYPYLRPGATVDFRDRLPYHLTAEGHVGYVVSLAGGNYTNGQGAIPAGNIESSELVPMSVDLQWSPLDVVSLQWTGGYVYDLLGSYPLQAVNGSDQTDLYTRVDAVWTPTNRLDVKLFFVANWFDAPIAFVPQVGAGIAYRL